MSEGSEISFAIQSHRFADTVKVFTTRADTLHGVTYIVLAPEHELVQKLRFQISNFPEVEKYVSDVKNKDEVARTNAEKEKTGVELKGVIALNPLNGESLPVWVADYVLPGYGTGAVMAVPAHDERDAAFATKFGLKVKEIEVVDTAENRTHITEQVKGNIVTKFKLRDWIFSRQRYWGEPIPIIHCEKWRKSTCRYRELGKYKMSKV